MRLLLALLVCCLTAHNILAAEWPQFRGPEGQGVVTSAENLPTTWSESEHIQWKTPIPGKGWSSPVIENGTIWLTTSFVKPLTGAALEREKQKFASNPVSKNMEFIGDVTLHVIAVDAETGRITRNIELFSVQNPDPIHSLNSYASPTPVIADGKVYCHFGANGTACLDATTGEVLWRQKLVIDHSVGAGSSPVLYGDRLILTCDGKDTQFIAALSTETGKVAWKTDRPPMQGNVDEMHKAYCTPLMINIDGQDQVVIPGAQWLCAYEPTTGRELWRINHGKGFSTVPRPVYQNGIFYMITGFMRPEIVAVDPTGHGDVTSSHILWRFNRQVPTMSSPVLVNDTVQFIGNKGVLTSLDSQSGKQLDQKRLPGNFISSPLFADGKLYLSNTDGNTFVLDSNWNELAENHLPGDIMASPAILGDDLIMRTEWGLFRIGE
ncbi:PQQ-binding-like beta-propeller repeat protein [Calycomorphotria hydatis]|uniref:Outer membrane protein assembly factor BamB n=1 Tax=Calycomorphotria hydatis TaxID=2528027 RepID=A0A517TDB1_9PLAN|nr:PQQ-binding-like beta-propeller repeat protein [Calycomorphotria hydatis]QDT66359.1 Outer membrane protein assembly factor BamB precursor [Calycomorphotria hydatis]